ncbi:MAG TPA: contact-dependent growth inhibition system immunity protein [Vicinamibacterales bacterium]|jgi:hypothetical protein
MTRAATAEFPELTRVFSGYLHEDFAAEYGSPDAALQAFREDASPDEWRRFQREAARFVRWAEAGRFSDVGALAQQMGSRWSPPSHDALIALVSTAAGVKRR